MIKSQSRGVGGVRWGPRAAEAACGEGLPPTARAPAEAACGEGTRRAGRGAEGGGNGRGWNGSGAGPQWSPLGAGMEAGRGLVL